jgi:hypothetical protein
MSLFSSQITISSSFSLSVCPRGSAERVTKQEFRSRTPILGSYGLQKLYLRRYRCTVCGKKFITPRHAVVVRCHRYAAAFKEVAARVTQTGYRPLWKPKEDLSTAFGIAPSHQAIHDWLVRDDERRIETSASHYSGYFCYAEQHIELAGQKRYRLTLFDSI